MEKQFSHISLVTNCDYKFHCKNIDAKADHKNVSEIDYRLPMWFGDVRLDTLSATQWIHYVEKTRGKNIDI
jgi:hypothetical protein